MSQHNTEHEQLARQPKSNLAGKVFGRIRNELLIELVVSGACFLLAFSLTARVVVSAGVACIRFAIPDAVTAYLVVKHDPDRWHGYAVGLLFLAMGMCRSAVIAFCVMMGGSIIASALNIGPGGVLSTTLLTCAGVVYAFLLLIFPSTFLAYGISKFSKHKLYFMHELTRIRRSADSGSKADYSIQDSLKLIALVSSISLSIVVCSSLFVYALFPKVQAGPEVLVILLAAFVGVPVWFRAFTSGVIPVDAGTWP